MSFLIATPMYGGQCLEPYFRSCLRLKEDLLIAGVEHDWTTGYNESLIQRARNKLATRFLETSYRKILFIDADIEFASEAVANLWNLQTDIAVGLYPMKRVDAPLGGWIDGKLVDLKDCPEEPFRVDLAGTGFMMIDREVFEAFQRAWPERAHDESEGKCFAWFDPRVDDGIYLSEDYAFCKDARSLGYEVIADPSIELTHWGSFGYRRA